MEKKTKDEMEASTYGLGLVEWVTKWKNAIETG